MSRANVHSRSAIYPALCDRVEGDQFLFEEEMHETENWSMDREMEKGERGREGLWYFASSCSIDGALKLINPRRQSASFVLSSILNVSACCTHFTQTRVSSIPKAECCSPNVVDLLIPLGIFTWNLSNATRVFPFRDLGPCAIYDGCDNSLHESTRTRLKL